MEFSTLKTKLFLDYPIPPVLSIWGEDNQDLGISLQQLVELVLDELSSDLEIYEHTDATGLYTYLPKGTKTVTSVKLDTPFQGNRFVKFSFDVDNLCCIVRYVPAKITYKRAVRLDDLETLKGARFRYIKAAILSKMASKEISYLSTVKLESDAGSVDLEELKEFKSKQDALVEQLHEDVMLYSNL